MNGAPICGLALGLVFGLACGLGWGGLFVDGEVAGEGVGGVVFGARFWGGVGSWGGGRGWVVAEVGGGYLQAVEEDAGSFGVHLVGGEALDDVGDGLLDGGAVLGAGDGEGVVGDDVGHVFGDVVVAGVLVAHGVGAAADAFGVDPDALVRDGWVLLEFGIEQHGVPPPGVYIQVIDAE